MEGLPDQRRDRLKTMTLDAAEFIAAFSCTFCPAVSIASDTRPVRLTVRARNIECVRQLLATPEICDCPFAGRRPQRRRQRCARPSMSGVAGGRMIFIETFDGVRPAQPPIVAPDQVSTPHDHRCASHLEPPIAFAPTGAPETSRCPHQVVSLPPTAVTAPRPPILATERARHHRFRRQDCAPPAPPRHTPAVAIQKSP